MTWLQRDLDVAVLLADGAGVVISQIDAAYGHADVVYQRAELGRRNDLADRIADPAELIGTVLDARADLETHVHQDLAGVHHGEEVAPEHRHQQE